MAQVIVDSDTLAKLCVLRDPVEVRGEDGQLVGFFRPAIPIADIQEMTAESPFSEAELQAMWNQERAGRPLADILREFGASQLESDPNS